jgi:hypothetical protein
MINLLVKGIFLASQEYLNRPFWDWFLLHCATLNTFVTPFFYPLRNCWRLQIPVSESETGKRVSKYFESREAAESFISKHYKTGSAQLAELTIRERHAHHRRGGRWDKSCNRRIWQEAIGWNDLAIKINLVQPSYT